ncbi:sensor histidine kinase [Streptomyces yaizuensis]|uniref:sensor histidine kinase n=1 Tax=Streptomyces yaizuensis TaxID=2989713 RepID=UPI002B208EA4|nr:histidine kinase [Streptomyces sp. YSPA8]
MLGVVAPLTRAVTWTRWLHLFLGAIVPLTCGMVYPSLSRPTAFDWMVVALLPVPLVLVVALIPVVRRAEGLQAQLMLFPGPHARVPGAGEPGVSAVPSASWSDRARTGAWLVLRMEAGLAAVLVTGQLMAMTLTLAGAGGARDGMIGPLAGVTGSGGVCVLLAPVPAAVALALATAAGAMMGAAARRLLGPSARERLAELEDRTERLLERNRIARELHDSLGHALTLAVVQAGAARTAGDPGFTDRALETIEEAGRAALEDLERVLAVLRETGRPPAGARPTLGEAGFLLDSARSAGARVDARVTGPLKEVPGPASREGYRMLQEALTNVLRHAGPAPVAVRVRITVTGTRLLLQVRNPLPTTPAPAPVPGPGSGLRGIRERAALLGGAARAGRTGDDWLLDVDLPLR